MNSGGIPFSQSTRTSTSSTSKGKLYGWDDEKITTEKIAKLGDWDPSAGVIEIDEDNVERTLEPDEVVYLKPGIEFGRKLRWKRG